MTDNPETGRKKCLKKYEPPQLIRLTSPDFGFGVCSVGQSVVKYRTHEHWGTCVTGNQALEGCHAGSRAG